MGQAVNLEEKEEMPFGDGTEEAPIDVEAVYNHKVWSSPQVQINLPEFKKLISYVAYCITFKARCTNVLQW